MSKDKFRGVLEGLLELLERPADRALTIGRPPRGLAPRRGDAACARRTSSRPTW